MGKIVISTNVSFDGIVQDPDGQEGFRLGGWFGQFGGQDLEECESSKKLWRSSFNATGTRTSSSARTARKTVPIPPRPSSRTIS